KEKGSALSISPKGTRKMEGGGTWKFHAKARVDFYAVFGPLKDREEVLDTTRLGDGFHRLMLVAEEDTEIAAQGCAMMEIKVANCKGRLRLNKPRAGRNAWCSSWTGARSGNSAGRGSSFSTAPRSPWAQASMLSRSTLSRRRTECRP
ncbi:MAG: hypothetical protein ACYTHM_24750, partial [Planctomycetota bacterium]